MLHCHDPVAFVSHGLPRRGWREFHLTAMPPQVAAAGDAEACYEPLVATLALHDAEVVGEKVYGRLAARGAILAARERVLRRHCRAVDTPVHFVDGAPPDGGEFGGVQVAAVAHDDDVTMVQDVPGGRLVQLPTGRLLHLTAVQGDGRAPFAAQAAGMFERAEALAAGHGFRYPQVARTWLYLAELLRDYAALNQVRSAFHRRVGNEPPASTGIQGRTGQGLCSMDALFVEGVEVRRIDRTCRQGPASVYGSAFSRAVCLEWAGGTTLHVSGTASIGRDGASRHVDDPTTQYLETMLDVGAVLAEAGLGFRDVVQATLFCKSPAVHDACVAAHRLLGLPPLPAVAVVADVCRPELLVEVEAVACR